MRITVDYSSGHDLTHIPDEILEQCFNSDAILISAWGQRKQLGTLAYRARDTTEIIWLYVEPQYRRQGVAKTLVDWLWNHKVLTCSVPDTMLEMHLFLRSQHFKARVDGDNYLFRRKL